MKDIRERAIRGGFAKICGQAANYILRIGSLMVMARLLSPRDFGLVGMVTALTGVLALFRDFGLSAATVQQVDVTDRQISTLFWINILVGVVLGVLTAAMAPIAVAFYHEPHLFWVTIALGTAFVFNAAGVQHSALLQRQMRFTGLLRSRWSALSACG
jgi:O-antigen/teichoic acid export membrane protein